MGRAILPHFLKAGHAVTAVVRSQPSETFHGDRLDKVTWVVGNLADPGMVASLPPVVDAVVHFASRLVVSDDRYDLFASDNVLATGHLLRYAMDRGAKKMIYASSITVHGTVATGCIDEHTPIFDPNPYGVTKHAGERFLAASRLPSVALRLPGILGPNAHPRLWLMRLLSGVLANADIPIYNSDTPFNTAVHVADLGPWIVHLLENEWLGFHPLPLGAATALSVRGVVEYLIQKTGSRSRIADQGAKAGAFWVDSSLARHRFNFNSMTMEAMLDRLMEDHGVTVRSVATIQSP